MTPEDLGTLKERFSQYSETCISAAEDPGPYVLKRDHTRRVCEEILALGRQLELPRTDFLLAEAAALLHDVGRFRQLKKYGTFVDQHSVNHARLGLMVIREQQWLASFTIAGRDSYQPVNIIRGLPSTRLKAVS